jgi:apolipoprotein N-acyltransferase
MDSIRFEASKSILVLWVFLFFLNFYLLGANFYFDILVNFLPFTYFLFLLSIMYFLFFAFRVYISNKLIFNAIIYFLLFLIFVFLLLPFIFDNPSSFFEKILNSI